MVALLVCLSAAAVSWFDPPFAAVLAVLGAVGGGLCGFVMPALAYLMVYHEDKTWGEKVCTDLTYQALPVACIHSDLTYQALACIHSADSTCLHALALQHLHRQLLT